MVFIDLMVQWIVITTLYSDANMKQSCDKALYYLQNNNCTQSFLRSFCEIGGDCFWNQGIYLRERSSPGGGGYFHRNAIRGRAAQMGRFLTKNP